MRPTRRRILSTGLAGVAAAVLPGTTAAAPQSSALRPVKVPPPRSFTGDWSSLVSGYSAPDWFRDAKFGIWAHWGAASVPAAGDDWYARHMYLQGHPSYEHHMKHYGHPADTGFMDIQHRWKAEGAAHFLDRVAIPHFESSVKWSPQGHSEFRQSLDLCGAKCGVVCKGLESHDYKSIAIGNSGIPPSPPV